MITYLTTCFPFFFFFPTSLVVHQGRDGRIHDQTTADEGTCAAHPTVLLQLECLSFVMPFIIFFVSIVHREP